MLKGNYILTGPVNSGKTSQLINIVIGILCEGGDISGILSVKVNGGYDAVLLSGPIPKHSTFIRNHRFKDSFKWRRFWFSKKVFSEFGKIAKEKRNDIFVIDEVGPLELADKKGFFPYLDTAYKNHKSTITVVRKDSLQQFLDFYNKTRR